MLSLERVESQMGAPRENLTPGAVVKVWASLQVREDKEAAAAGAPQVFKFDEAYTVRGAGPRQVEVKLKLPHVKKSTAFVSIHGVLSVVSATGARRTFVLNFNSPTFHLVSKNDGAVQLKDVLLSSGEGIGGEDRGGGMESGEKDTEAAGAEGAEAQAPGWDHAISVLAKVPTNLHMSMQHVRRSLLTKLSTTDKADIAYRHRLDPILRGGAVSGVGMGSGSSAVSGMGSASAGSESALLALPFVEGEILCGHQDGASSFVNRTLAGATHVCVVSSHEQAWQISEPDGTDQLDPIVVEKGHVRVRFIPGQVATLTGRVVARYDPESGRILGAFEDDSSDGSFLVGYSLRPVAGEADLYLVWVDTYTGRMQRSQRNGQDHKELPGPASQVAVASPPTEAAAAAAASSAAAEGAANPNGRGDSSGSVAPVETLCTAVGQLADSLDRLLRLSSSGNNNHANLLSDSIVNSNSNSINTADALMNGNPNPGVNPSANSRSDASSRSPRDHALQGGVPSSSGSTPAGQASPYGSRESATVGLSSSRGSQGAAPATPRVFRRLDESFTLSKDPNDLEAMISRSPNLNLPLVPRGLGPEQTRWKTLARLFHQDYSTPTVAAHVANITSGYSATFAGSYFFAGCIKNDFRMSMFPFYPDQADVFLLGVGGINRLFYGVEGVIIYRLRPLSNPASDEQDIHAAIVIECPLYQIDASFPNRVHAMLYGNKKLVSLFSSPQRVYKVLSGSSGNKEHFATPMKWSTSFSANTRDEGEPLGPPLVVGARISPEKQCRLEIVFSDV